MVEDEAPAMSNTFDSDATHAMGLAFDGICESLRVRSDAVHDRQTIAVRVIELAKSGELDPVAIYGRVVNERKLRQARPR
jgi:hypothetical protein